MADTDPPFNVGQLPTVLSSAGMRPTSPSVLRAQLVEIVAKTNPGFTSNLPGTLIEDIVSTNTQALVMIDQARVEVVNSLTPYGCNEFVLMQLGKVYGVDIGQPVNTSVYVIFTGDPGFIVAKGFTVTDGTYQYVIQEGGVIGAGFESGPLFAVATRQGTWAVPTGTVSGLVTPPPAGYTLTVNNPAPGIPSVAAETATQYRARVLRAGLSSSQGTPRYLRTLLSNIPGVSARLIGIKQDVGGWMIMVGGGDPYLVAYAIYQSLFDITGLVQSRNAVNTMTAANPSIVTTNLNHGLRVGDNVTVTGATPAGYNGTGLVASVGTLKTFTWTKNNGGLGAYTSGTGTVTNPRNWTISIKDPPDTYQVAYVSPLAQQVRATVSWGESSPNLVSEVAVAQAAEQPLADYINSVIVGHPINVLQMKDVFQNAIAAILPQAYIAQLDISFTFDNVAATPSLPTHLVFGDPHSFFFASPADFTFVRL